LTKDAENDIISFSKLAAVKVVEKMGNRFQIALYNLTSEFPIVFVVVFIFLRFNEFSNPILPLVILIIVALINVFFYKYFDYAVNNLENVFINLRRFEEVSEFDFKSVISCVISVGAVLLPDQTQSAFTIQINTITVMSILIFYIFFKKPSKKLPLILWLLRYRCYLIDTEEGANKGMLITKEKIRKCRDITHVKRYFEGVYIL